MGCSNGSHSNYSLYRPVFTALCPSPIIERFQWRIEAVGYNPEQREFVAYDAGACCRVESRRGGRRSRE